MRCLSARVASALAILALSASAPAFAQGGAKPRGPAPAASPSSARSTSPAAPQGLVERGRALFEDQQYEESIQVLSAALLRPDNTKAQRVEIHRLLALDYITLGRKDEAESAVRGLLVIDPAHQLPPGESPRFRDFFAQARARWEADGRPGIVVEKAPPKPVALRHASPSSAVPDRELELRGRLEDPDGRVKSLRLLYRTGTKADFTEAEVELDSSGQGFVARVPRAAVRAPIVEYYLVAEGEGGSPLVARGEPTSPLRVTVGEPSKSWVLPVAIGGGVLGAAALVGVLALAGVFKSTSSPQAPGPGTSIVSVSVSEAAR
jgi:hypothetical protein